MRDRFREISARTPGIVALEATLLVEAGYAPDFDLVVAVEADPAIRKRCSLYLFEAPTVEQATARLEGIAQRERLVLAPGVARLIVERKRAVPRDCLGVLYELSFEGPVITLAAADGLLAQE